MKEIKKHIRDHQFNKVYLLLGDEDYMINQAKVLLKRAMVPQDDDMNCLVINSSKINFADLSEYAMTFPFFSEKRVIILDRTDVIKSGGDTFLDILKNLPESSCVIICENKVDKKTKAYKWIKKNEYVEEFSKAKDNDAMLRQWVATMLKRAGKKIRVSDCSYLISRTGSDMYSLKNEVDKLISYVGDRDEVTGADIDAICSGETENKIFDMISAISEGEKRKALLAYNDLLILKEPAMRILFLITRQYRILLMIADMSSLGKSEADIAAKAGVRGFVVRKNVRLAKSYGKDRLTDCLDQCVRIEEEVKTGLIGDQLGLETLIVGLAEGK